LPPTWASAASAMESDVPLPSRDDSAAAATGSSSTAQESGTEVQQLSKKQQKRLAKREMVKEKRIEKRQAVKQAKREKRAASQIEWDAMSEDAREEQRRKSAEVRAERNAAAERAAAAAAAAADENRTVPTCVVDLGFEELMNEREIGSLAQQLSYCYCANRRASFPVHLVYTSFGGAVEKVLTAGYRNWSAVKYEPRSYLDAFAKERLVYLTSESENVLDGPLEAGDVYVVGGLVDHNRQKGLTHHNAMEAGLRTARLPIDEHLEMSQRRVLAVNHVVEILVHRASGLEWADALLRVMPARRSATARTAGDDGVAAQEKQGEEGLDDADADAEQDMKQ